MSRIAILDDGPDDWQVWIALEDERPPHVLSFIIGSGKTRDEAVAAAVADLEACIDKLQGPLLPPGTPDPRD